MEDGDNNSLGLYGSSHLAGTSSTAGAIDTLLKRSHLWGAWVPGRVGSTGDGPRWVPQLDHHHPKMEGPHGAALVKALLPAQASESTYRAQRCARSQVLSASANPPSSTELVPSL